MKGSTLEVDIPRGPLFDMERAGSASFALVWNGTTAVWTLSALAAGSIIGAAFSLPFWFAGKTWNLILDYGGACHVNWMTPLFAVQEL